MMSKRHKIINIFLFTLHFVEGFVPVGSLVHDKVPFPFSGEMQLHPSGK